MKQTEVRSEGTFHSASVIVGKNAACKGESRKAQPRRLSKEPQLKSALGDAMSMTGGMNARSNGQGLACPECGLQNLFKDGLRYLWDGNTIQRWLCRNCGLRFSEKGPQGSTRPPQKTSQFSQHVSIFSTKSLKGKAEKVYERKVCAALARGTKNLAEVETRQEKPMREGTKTDQATVKGKIVQFVWKLKNEGYQETTIREYATELETLLRKGANLLDPESVKEVIANQPLQDTTKRNYANAYDAFAKTLDLNWKKPRYKPTEHFPFIPLESDIDQLIFGTGKKLGTALQIAKETGMRVGEILRLKWTDVQPEQNLIMINKPEKGSAAGAYKVSSQLISRIMALPKTSERIFATSVNSITARLRQTRKNLAKKLSNPRLEKITFHTLRHWKGTMLYHKTRDPLYVQQFLRHKNIKNTMIYINIERVLFQSGSDDEFHVKVAKTLDEACELLKIGFEYVTDMENVKIFRKRK